MTITVRKDLPPDPFVKMPTPRVPRREQALPTSRATQPQQRARAHVHQSAATQSINSGAVTVVEFNTIDFDPTGLFTANRFTIPLTGKITGSWRIHGHAIFAQAAGGTVRELLLRKNGATVVRSVVEPNVLDSLDVDLIINDPVPGDYYELAVNQDSGGAINLTTTVENTYFEIIHLW